MKLRKLLGSTLYEAYPSQNILYQLASVLYTLFYIRSSKTYTPYEPVGICNPFRYSYIILYL